MLFNRQLTKRDLDIVTGMLIFFHFYVYALFDPSATLSFVTRYVAMKFDMLRNVLKRTFFSLHLELLLDSVKESL